MNDYSDLLLAMGAMVIFSILLMNTNRSLLRSDTMQVDTELEHTAISLAQGVIDQARVKDFMDKEASTAFGQNMVGQQIMNIASIEEQENNISITWDAETTYGEYELELKVYYVQRDTPDVINAGPTDYQRMDVIVSSNYLSNNITLSYIKSRY